MKNLPFDPQKPVMVITCAACKEPLWRMTILSASSVEHTPVGANKAKFSDKTVGCPLCGEQFFQVSKNGLQSYRMYSEMTRKVFWV